MTEAYTSKDVCKLTGCTHRQLQYWEQKGYLKPSLGSRNVRYYNESSLQVIEQIIRNKKTGKSLGEAYVLGEQHAHTPELVRSDFIADLQKLEEEWFKQNEELLKILDEIFKLENTIPRYPYFIYNESNLIALKNYQEKAKKLKKQKDQLFYEIQALLLEKSAPLIQVPENSPPMVEVSATSANDHYFSIDQLVLLYMKKNPAISTQTIRDTLSVRLRSGETTSQIASEILEDALPGGIKP